MSDNRYYVYINTGNSDRQYFGATLVRVGVKLDMNNRHRFALAAAIVNAAVVAWDVHNSHIIQRMGMAWDTGAPVWPYQTSEILFLALNAPSYLLANPIIHYGRMFTPEDYIVRYPISVLWWYLVGLYFDRRIPNAPQRRWGRAGLCIAGAIFFGTAAVMIARDGFRWNYYETPFVRSVVLLREFAPAAWSLAFTVALARGAWRMLRLSPR